VVHVLAVNVESVDLANQLSEKDFIDASRLRRAMKPFSDSWFAILSPNGRIGLPPLAESTLSIWQTLLQGGFIGAFRLRRVIKPLTRSSRSKLTEIAAPIARDDAQASFLRRLGVN
jgi:hypothetical protein